jgi:hypothetical protein
MGSVSVTVGGVAVATARSRSRALLGTETSQTCLDAVMESGV